MLRKHCSESQQDWDESIQFVMFAAREAVQESLGFSPTQLVFGHEVRGPFKMLKEQLESPTKKVTRVSEYVDKLRNRLQRACSLAREALRSSQVKMKRHFDQKAVAHSFQPGDKVLLLLPVAGSSLSAKFSGPYAVGKKLSETNYMIHTPDRRRRTRVCHVNMMKLYHPRDERSESSVHSESSTVVSPVVSFSGVCSDGDEDGLVMPSAAPQGARLSNSKVLSNLPHFLSHLSHNQSKDVEQLIREYPSLLVMFPPRHQSSAMTLS